MDERRNERFGRYEILSELGRGAMGVVYKARDPKINRVVAVKTVSLAGQGPDEEREYRERFFREAEAAGRLSHPGIVTIFDVGEEPETRSPYIVMEFVGGQSLEKLLSLKDQKLPVETALQLTLELAEALDCAHGQGVVHRDLKPANILLTEDGHPKIGDFGVAKLNLANHTLAGRALGTPAYMSPEQLNGETVDGRSDLFSLGVILYTVLTGYRPFQGNSAVTVSFKVVNREPIPATLLDTELPHGLDYIIGRAMAKDPAERYQRGMELVLDIQELHAGREPWSKAKLPGPNGGRLSVGTAGGGTKSRTAGLGSYASSLPPASMTGFRWKPFVGALVLFALLMFGLWAVSLHTQAARSGGIGESAAPIESSSDKEKPAPVAIATMNAQPSVSAQTESASQIPARSDSAKVHSTGPPAILDIEVEHRFAEAHLSVWIDNHLSYTHSLEASEKKHLIVLHRLQGHETHAVQLVPGRHRVRVRVTSTGHTLDQSATLAGDFSNAKESVLRIDFNDHGAMHVKLQ